MVGGTGSKKNIVRVLLFLGMMICFSFQIFDTFEKYLAKKTSISVSRQLKTVDEPLPTFSVCSDPPFNEDMLVKDFEVARNFFFASSYFRLELFPENASLSNVWKSASYNPIYVQIMNDQVLQGQIITNTTTELEYVQTFNSLWYGKCTTFALKTPKKAQSEQLFIFIYYQK